MHIHIHVTRFSCKTFEENINFRNNKNIDCIYGSPIKISENILPNELIIVIEMNNSLNIIEGIGIIKNNYLKDEKKKYKIYSDNNYNRFVYKSKYRIDKNSFTNYEKKYIKELDNILFYSSKHFKRGHGIQKLPKYIKYLKFNFNKFIETIYLSRFVNIKLKNIKILK